MDICNDKHDEICYEGRICPLCDVIDAFTAQIEGLERDIKSLESENEGLQNQLEDIIIGDSNG